MTTATKATPRRLLPVLPALNVDLASRVQVLGPVKSGRQQILKFANPIALSGELSFELASILSLTVEDPDDELLSDPLLKERLTLTLGSAIELRYIADWVLDLDQGIGGVSTAGTTTVLTFWHVGPAAWKSKTTTKSWDATHMNFEAWVTVLATEPGVGDVAPLQVVVPRPGSTPPRETDTDSATTASGADGSSGSLGFSTETAKKVTVKGEPANESQLKLIDRVLRHNVKRGDGPLAVWGQVCANIGEAGFDEEAENPTSHAKGLFQLMPAPGWQARLDYHDIEKNIDVFQDDGFASSGGAKQIARENPHATPGTIASKVEGSDQGGAFYDEHAGEARTLIELWSGVTLDKWSTVTGPAGTSDPRDEAASSNERPTAWRRGNAKTAESSWTALSRTCDGLGRRRFISAGRIVAARDQDLILAAPHMAFALTDRDIVNERPNIDLRGNARLTGIELRAVAGSWTAPPGAVVDVLGTSRAAGAWLVKTIRFTAGDPLIDVEIAKPTTKIPSGSGSRPSTEKAENGSAAAIKWAEQRIGIAEKPAGSNDGPEVAALIRSQGGTPGQPWCGYFCRGALRAAGLNAPVGMASVRWIYDNSAKNVAPFRGRTKPQQARAGDLGIIVGIGHVTLVIAVDLTRQEITTIEGNHSDRCERVTRPMSAFAAVAQVDYSRATAKKDTTDSATEVLDGVV